MQYVGQRQDWNKSGIYQISNTLDDRVYIGSTRRLRDRYRHHRRQLLNNKNPSIILQRFASKYGVDKLVFTVLEVVTEELLLKREEFYLNNLNCKFNAMRTPLRQTGYKHKKSTVRKMRKIATASFKNGRKAWNKGKFIFSPEQVVLIRQRIQNGEKQVDIAKEFNVFPTTINRLYKQEYNGI